MPYAVSTYVSGRTGSAPVAPLRSTPADRKPASALSREDENTADEATRSRDAAAQDKAIARDAAQQQQADSRTQADRVKQQINEARDSSEARQTSDRKRDISGDAAADEIASESADERRVSTERAAGQQVSGRREAEQAAEAERRRAEASDAVKSEPKAKGDIQPEDIKKLEQIRAEALYPSPPTAKSRDIAQRAHTQIIRAEAELKASALEESRNKYRDQQAAKFQVKLAAAAYRQLEDFDGQNAGLLN